MCKEIEQWTALKKLDALLDLCNCCIYKTFDYILAEECRMCSVRKGIQEILTESGNAWKARNCSLLKAS